MYANKRQQRTFRIIMENQGEYYGKSTTGY
jgi:hypothetical protein